MKHRITALIASTALAIANVTLLACAIAITHPGTLMAGEKPQPSKSSEGMNGGIRQHEDISRTDIL